MLFKRLSVKADFLELELSLNCPISLDSPVSLDVVRYIAERESGALFVKQKYVGGRFAKFICSVFSSGTYAPALLPNQYTRPGRCGISGFLFEIS